ncbi:MAG: dienelactone hydrolase family protein [Bryobacteraceae bacterium]
MRARLAGGHWEAAFDGNSQGIYRPDEGDGTGMRAWTARSVAPGTHPGLLVFQEAFGVNAYIRDVTERFAREGYVAVAPELYHRTDPGFEGPYDDLTGALVHLRAIKSESLEADLRSPMIGSVVPLRKMHASGLWASASEAWQYFWAP